jgi:hypothetical protein
MAKNAKLKRELLHGPLLKIERAKQHVIDLNGKIADYIASNPFELRIGERKDSHSRIVYVKAKEPVPDAFALIVGDTVHNLRTALDFVCYGMVRDKAPKPDKVGFPFASRGAQGLTGAIATRQMQVAPKKVIDEIYSLQPYPTGNKVLYAVKAMAEREKHHFIVTVGRTMELTAHQLGILIGGHRVSNLDPRMRLATTGDMTVLMGEPSAATFDKKADFQPPFSVGFDQREALPNEPVIPALSQMVMVTEDAVRRLARAYFS